MRVWHAILLAAIMGTVPGCGGGSGGEAGEIINENDPNYGLSVAEKLKRDATAENAKVNGNAPGSKARTR